MSTLRTTEHLETRTDAELLDAASNGSIGAFGELLERYQNLVCSIGFAATGDRALSEDIAQETFVAAWKKLGQFEEPEKLRGWLSGTARNLSKMAIRKRRREVVQDSSADETRSKQQSPLDSLISKQDERALAAALAEVPETYREPLVLFYREEQSVSKVAAGLGISEAAVRQRLSRGRQSLRSGVAELFENKLPASRPTKTFAVGVIAAIVSQGALPPSAESAALSSAKTATATKLISRFAIAGGLVVALAFAIGFLLFTSRTEADPPAGEGTVIAAAPKDKTPKKRAPSTTTVPPANKSANKSADNAGVNRRVDTRLDATKPATIIKVEDVLGGPVVGARISTRHAAKPDAYVGITNRDGLVRWPASTASRVSRTIRVRATGYAPRTKRVGHFGLFTIQLTPESTLTGRVVSDESGAPVSGISVTLKGGEKVSTDHQGRFAFRSLAPGFYRPRATGVGFHGQMAEGIGVGLHQIAADAEIRVRPAFAIRGRVISKTALSPTTRVFAGNSSSPVAANGEFALEGLARGSYTVVASSRPVDARVVQLMGPGPNAQTFQLRNRDIQNVKLKAEPTHSLTIVAKDDRGDAAPGVEVIGMLVREAGGGVGVSCTTDRLGRCTIGGLERGTVNRLRPFIDNAKGVDVEIDRPSREQRIRVPTVSAISGRVTYAKGLPVRHRLVAVTRLDGSGQGVTGLTDDQGRFQVGGLLAGKFRVRVLALGGDSIATRILNDGARDLAMAEVDLRKGVVLQGVKLVVKHNPLTLSGRIVSDKGRPVADALVTYKVDDGSSVNRNGGNPQGIETVWTDESGGFQFSAVPNDGAYRVMALGPLGEQGAASGVLAGNKRLTVTVQKPTELRVVVRGIPQSDDLVSFEVTDAKGKVHRKATLKKGSGPAAKLATVSFVGMAPGPCKLLVTAGKKMKRVRCSVKSTKPTSLSLDL